MKSQPTLSLDNSLVSSFYFHSDHFTDIHFTATLSGTLNAQAKSLQVTHMTRGHLRLNNTDQGPQINGLSGAYTLGQPQPNAGVVSLRILEASLASHPAYLLCFLRHPR